MGVGKLTFHRFNGDEEFEIETAIILAEHDEDGFRLCFYIGTKGVRITRLPETEDLPARPNAEVAVVVTKIEPHKLVGRKFSVPAAWDEQIKDHVATIYYLDHDDLNNNEVEILGQEGNVFQVRWTGTTKDVNYYDGSKPGTRVEIDAMFTFQEMEKWLPDAKKPRRGKRK